MQKQIITTLCCLVLFLCPFVAGAESSEQEKSAGFEQSIAEKPNRPVEMLASLLELEKNLTEQIQLSQKKLKASTSEAEKAVLEKEISQFDKQLSESRSDFERIATGVEPSIFAEKKPQTFSWREELAGLLEPAIKELKRFTIKARQKTDLKDKITELEMLTVSASQAVSHLQKTADATAEKQVQKQVKALQPEWINVEKRLRNKLELAKSELAQLESQEVSLVETSKNSLRTFFKERGFYLIVAVLTFLAILLAFRLLYRGAAALSVRYTQQPEERSLQIRVLYIVFQMLSIIFAVVGLFFVLYLAEDWFLLSMAIIFFLGLAWTIRQGLPRFWQQVRLMLNIGSVRENERLILHGVPWMVASINVFCKLVNPSLNIELRVPIENLIGLVSRPWNPEEPWFPCKKGDWVVVGSNARGKVVSQSHEQVELVERGGRRIFYTTEAFLAACPTNLSRNFRLRVVFGISYNLQEKATAEIPAILKEHLNLKMKDEGYLDKCLNLQVEFMQAGASSLDLLILGDFEGGVANISKRIERAIQRWCVECCTKHDWEIPFPQLTVHQPAALHDQHVPSFGKLP